MKVTVVGTSCTWFKRNNTSFIIDDDIVFDTPDGAYKDIINYIDIFKIRCIIITHFHTDHFTDLHIFTTQILRHGKGRKEKLRVYGPKGILDKLIELNKLHVNADDECSKEEVLKAVDFIEVYDGMEFDEGKYHIKSFKMEHGKPETFGFTFCESDSGVVVGFSADTASCENLNKIIVSSNYAFVDFASMKKHDKHMFIEPFEKLLKDYSKTKIYPVHTSDENQKYAIEHGFNYLNDGDILNF